MLRLTDALIRGGSPQQYLAKNPYGYRCHANAGVAFPADA